MKQVFATRPLAALPVALAAATVFFPLSVRSAPVRGRVDAPRPPQMDGILGYTKTRVAGPSSALKDLRADVAVFLKVETSLPIPKPDQNSSVAVQGMRLVPDVATCAVDGRVTFTNLDPEAVTVRVGDVELRLAPEASQDFECTAGDALRSVRLKEWPHIRGLVFVGEVGVAGTLDARGAFNLSAPDGKYELEVVTRDGVIARRPLEVKGSTVDLGAIDLAAPAEDPAGEETP